MNKPLNPPTVMTPKGPYSQGIEVVSGARTVYVAGQGGQTPDGKFAEGLEAQAEQALRNIVHILESAGMGPQDIVRMTTFVVTDLVGMDLIKAMSGPRMKVLGAAAPTGVLVAVKGFAMPEMMIEIDAIAAKAG